VKEKRAFFSCTSLPPSPVPPPSLLAFVVAVDNAALTISAVHAAFGIYIILVTFALVADELAAFSTPSYSPPPPRTPFLFSNVKY
jgi:hypothetical protein